MLFFKGFCIFATMKRRSPNIAFITLLVLSAVIFCYFNFCPSVADQTIEATEYLIAMPQELMKYPEFEGLIKLVKAVVSFIKP